MEYSFFNLLAIILGLYVMIPKIMGICEVIQHSFLFKQHDIKKRYYDKDSWALVTGCTSGIGEEIAHRLASFGFNIILVSRSLERLNKVEDDFLRKHGSIKTLKLVVDFAKNGETIELYDSIYQQIKDLDIAILVNNAGVNTRDYIKDTKIYDIMEMLIANIYPYSFLTHQLMPKLKNRNHQKTAIINICSSSTIEPVCFDAIYSGTKTFELFTMEALRLENKNNDKIDFLIINPAYVSTNNARLPSGGQVETTETFTTSLFKALGNTSMTFGTPKHCRGGFILRLVSSIIAHFNIYQYISERVVTKLASQMWEKRV